jgi:predicted ATPase
MGRHFMKQAALRDSVRHLTEKSKTWPVRVERFAYKDIQGIGNGEVVFSSPLTIITGANSVGKTTFLRSIWMGLDAAKASQSDLTWRKVRSGSVEIDVYRFNGQYNRTVSVDRELEYEADDELDVYHVDSADAIVDLQQKLFSLGTSADIIDGAPEKLLGNHALSEVSYLTRRQYSSVKVFEVEISAELTAPFFEVTYGGRSYDATQMGSGEYAALFTWWTLENAPKGAIVLIEEPETFLSSLTQISLLSHLITVIDTKKLAVIVTSHSGHLLHNMPSDSVKYLIRVGDNCKFIDNPHPTTLETIGIYLKPDIFVYVEDVAAKIVGRLIIERFDPAFARRCRLESVGGESLITSALRASMTNPFGLTFVGWYDGDQKGKIPKDVLTAATLLPGDDAIEAIFRSVVTANIEAAAAAFSNERVPEVISNLEGQDCHDWSYRFSRALGRDHESVLSTMLDLWLKGAGNLGAVEACIDNLRRICANHHLPKPGAD